MNGRSCVSEGSSSLTRAKPFLLRPEVECKNAHGYDLQLQGYPPLRDTKETVGIRCVPEVRTAAVGLAGEWKSQA